MSGLTAAQRTMLRQIQQPGGRRYDGRSRRTIEALAAAGLVEYDHWYSHSSWRGSTVEIFLVRPKDTKSKRESK